MSADFVPAAPKGVRVTPSSTTLASSTSRGTSSERRTGSRRVELRRLGPGARPVHDEERRHRDEHVLPERAGWRRVHRAGVPAERCDRDGSRAVERDVGHRVGRRRSGTPDLTATGQPDGSTTAVSLSASETDWAGGTPSWRIAKYGPQTPIPSGCSTTGAERVFTGSTATDRISSQYRYVALADNGLFCTASQPASVQGYQAPDAPTGTVERAPQPGTTARSTSRRRRRRPRRTCTTPSAAASPCASAARPRWGRGRLRTRDERGVHRVCGGQPVLHLERREDRDRVHHARVRHERRRRTGAGDQPAGQQRAPAASGYEIFTASPFCSVRTRPTRLGPSDQVPSGYLHPVGDRERPAGPDRARGSVTSRPPAPPTRRPAPSRATPPQARVTTRQRSRTP